MMERNLSCSDLRMLKVLRDAAEKYKISKKFDNIRCSKDNMEVHGSKKSISSQVPAISMFSLREMEEQKKLCDEENNDVQKKKNSNKIVKNRRNERHETPRSRYLRECSESEHLTGAQLFGISVLKRNMDG